MTRKKKDPEKDDPTWDSMSLGTKVFGCTFIGAYIFNKGFTLIFHNDMPSGEFWEMKWKMWSVSFIVIFAAGFVGMLVDRRRRKESSQSRDMPDV